MFGLNKWNEENGGGGADLLVEHNKLTIFSGSSRTVSKDYRTLPSD
jgi:hypothetical protein